MPKVLQAVSAFLKTRASAANNADMLDRWHTRMETQINVSPEGGDAVPGRRNTWTNGTDEWFSIRIPKKASSEPEFTNFEMTFILGDHVEGIGSTGWDWRKRRSRWLGFDFDSITGHAKGVGISEEALAQVRQAARGIPWVEVRRSTGGNGLHLYVFFDEEGIPTVNHTEHAALGRALLGMMAQEAGFDFASAIDCAGGNMWLWHVRATTENQGLALIRAAERSLTVADLPPNWRDHVEVVTRRRAKVRVRGIEEQHLDPFERLASARRAVPLEESHHKVIGALQASGYSTLWVADHNLLQTHTHGLKKLLEDKKAELGLVGFFSTLSEGRDPGTPNCFMFPIAGDGWQVFRFSPGAPETAMWEQDGAGWTTCRFNVLPDLAMAAKANGGLEDPDGKGWVFDTFQKARGAADVLGQKIILPEKMDGRETTLKSNKAGRLVVEVKKQDGDDGMSGWLPKKGFWTKVFQARTQRTAANGEDYDKYDDIVRALISPADEDAGFVVRAGEGNAWVRHQSGNVKHALLALGHTEADAKKIIGASVLRGWRLVSLPFHAEYPGGRKWNYRAAQFRYEPATLDYDDQPEHPHWDSILNHCGSDLNEPLRESEWAKRHGVKTGGDYLRLWIACMLREPFEPLPYLFLFGDQNCGKSILHESIKLLVTDGVVAGDRALTNQGDFNGELANAVLCYVEEVDLRVAGPAAYNKIKDWVTGRTISIHPKRKDVYTQPNTTHWIQCANTREACPIFKGDTRIVVMRVPDLESEIPKPLLIQKLEAEAPHFIRTIMDIDLPEYSGRLRVPVIETYAKVRAAEDNRTPLQVFLEENVVYAPGHAIQFGDFYDRFEAGLTPEERSYWTKTKVSRSLPDQFPVAASGGDNQTHIGNAAWEPVSAVLPPLVKKDKRLVHDEARRSVNLSDQAA